MTWGDFWGDVPRTRVQCILKESGPEGSQGQKKKEQRREEGRKGEKKEEEEKCNPGSTTAFLSSLVSTLQIILGGPVKEESC